MQDITERIPHLIYKYTVGTVNDRERDELEAWRRQDTANEELFCRLTDPVFLEREYRRRRHINAGRALADMKRRIGSNAVATASPASPAVTTKVADNRSSHQRRGARHYYMVAAAAVLMLIGMAAVVRYYVMPAEQPVAEQSAMGAIRHGETRAILTLSNGMPVELGADSAKNVAAINRATASTGKSSRRVAGGDDSLKASHGTLNLSIPRGGEFRLTLEDGTEVWLNAESKLVYPETFDGSERRVELYGEAYFKVAKDAVKPFIVESAGQEVRVMGTEFNIHNYKEEPSVYTTLVNGSIALKPRDNSGELVLTPGHQAVFSKADRHADVRTVDTNTVTCWKDGRFVFEDQTLEQIMRTLSRWYDFTYEFKDKELSNTLFMGSIPRYGDFGDVARILEASGGLRFKVDGRNVQIYRIYGRNVQMSRRSRI